MKREEFEKQKHTLNTLTYVGGLSEKAKSQIIGASQRVYETADGKYSACYHCHKCSHQFAHSYEFCETEAIARNDSEGHFDYQSRCYCHICGYKLSTRNDDEPEDHIIFCLNVQIDELRKQNSDCWSMIEGLEKELKEKEREIVEYLKYK